MQLDSTCISYFYIFINLYQLIDLQPILSNSTKYQTFRNIVKLVWRAIGHWTALNSIMIFYKKKKKCHKFQELVADSYFENNWLTVYSILNCLLRWTSSIFFVHISNEGTFEGQERKEQLDDDHSY